MAECALHRTRVPEKRPADRAAASDTSGLRARVDRDLHDAEVPGVSLDRRFVLACQAASGLAALARHAHASAPVGSDKTGATARLPTAHPVSGLGVRYLERCRAKCWRIENIGADCTSELEVEELLLELVRWRASLALALDEGGPAPAGAGPHASSGSGHAERERRTPTPYGTM